MNNKKTKNEESVGDGRKLANRYGAAPPRTNEAIEFCRSNN